MGKNHDLALRNAHFAEMPAELQRRGVWETASQIGGGRFEGLFVKKRIEWSDEPDKNAAEFWSEKSQTEQEETDAESVSACVTKIFRFFLHDVLRLLKPFGCDVSDYSGEYCRDWRYDEAAEKPFPKT